MHVILDCNGLLTLLTSTLRNECTCIFQCTCRNKANTRSIDSSYPFRQVYTVYSLPSVARATPNKHRHRKFHICRWDDPTTESFSHGVTWSCRQRNLKSYHRESMANIPRGDSIPLSYTSYVHWSYFLHWSYVLRCLKLLTLIRDLWGYKGREYRDHFIDQSKLYLSGYTRTALDVCCDNISTKAKIERTNKDHNWEELESTS
jgi:hypothetical protein